MQSIDAARVVIDAEGRYVTIVQFYDAMGHLLDHPYNYRLAEGERVISANSPTMRQHAGAAGYIDPRWDDDAEAWIEGATAEQIAAWEAEHPAPEEPEDPTPPSGDLEQRVTTLEATSATKADVQAVWDEMAAAYTEGVNSI